MVRGVTPPANDPTALSVPWEDGVCFEYMGTAAYFY